jgi:SAM-dependent methyltransferase
MQMRDRLLGLDGEFHLVRCRRCGLIYQNPCLTAEALARYYPPEYHPFLRAIEDEPSPVRRWDRRRGVDRRCRAVIARAEVRTGRALDVGCGTGIFLDGMRRWGWEAHGVEPSAVASAYARERLGLPVLTAELESAGYPAEFFDVVTLWDVLEHVPDPRRTLSAAWRALRPGGLLALSLPNLESVEARWFGRYWAGWDAPRHLALFPRDVLIRLLRETGFGDVELTAFTGYHGVLALSVDFWLKDRVRNPRLRRLLSALTASWPARALTWPYYQLANRRVASSIMVVFARKSEASAP